MTTPRQHPNDAYIEGEAAGHLRGLREAERAVADESLSADVTDCCDLAYNTAVGDAANAIRALIAAAQR